MKRGPDHGLDGLQALKRLLRDSLRKGHWRVACRRYLMLGAAGSAVSPELRSECERLLMGLSPGQLQAMRASAAQWAEMTDSQARQGNFADTLRPSAHSLKNASPFRAAWSPAMAMPSHNYGR